MVMSMSVLIVMMMVFVLLFFLVVMPAAAIVVMMVVMVMMFVFRLFVELFQKLVYHGNVAFERFEKFFAFQPDHGRGNNRCLRVDFADQFCRSFDLFVGKLIRFG